MSKKAHLFNEMGVLLRWSIITYDVPGTHRNSSLDPIKPVSGHGGIGRGVRGSEWPEGRVVESQGKAQFLGHSAVGGPTAGVVVGRDQGVELGQCVRLFRFPAMGSSASRRGGRVSSVRVQP